MRKKRLSKIDLFAIVALIVLFLLVFNFIKEIVNSREINREVSGLEKEIYALKEDNSELSKFISEWKIGSQLEKEARTKLGLQKPGEKVVLITHDQIVEKDADLNDNTEIIGNIVKEKAVFDILANPRRWLQYFFN